ncbi:nucleotidyltransferase domain-containing protein [Ectobacillus sp. SYSU M60031]|uniref:Nucleotidyltransferase domain-containing protein n=1 Tax=Ectobacillus ponti TaxID=2961894 RepID=A0AA41XBQ8_9BACI|nr:nucleotidyltransferase domain-containing protein [Ectobacillus ponti]
MGNYKNGSDVDLTLVGKGITKSTLYGLHDLLDEEYPLPYFFDVLNYHDIENPKLVEHIDTVGKVTYSRC